MKSTLSGNPAALAILVAVCGTVSHADQVFNDDVIITQSGLCVGINCANNESFLDGMVKLKDTGPRIVFDDTANIPDEPGTDWRLIANDDFQFGRSYFAIEDLSNNTVPFQVESFSPTNAVYIERTFGDVGLGTAMPQQDMHIVDGDTPTLRFEQDGSQLLTPQVWDLSANGTAFFLRDTTGTVTLPLIVRPDAPDSSIDVASSGNVGLGTATPEGKLHTKGDGVQLAYFESGDGGPVQVRFRTDSENRRFLAVNNANEVKSQIIFLDDRINFTGQTDSGANLWLSIGPNGITSQGPTCSNPCDLTFDPDVFTVPSIEARAARMWQDMHLPAIGPTSPDQPMNLTEKMGGVIHELEIAHIYIEQLHGEIARLQTEVARIDDLAARLNQLEAQ